MINLIQTNIALHWGGYVGDISSRISVAMQSPHNEIVEYMNEYVNISDILTLFYIMVVIVISILFLLKYKQNKASKYVYIFLVISLAILQNQEPLKTVKYFFKTAKINNAILNRAITLQNYDLITKNQPLGFYDNVIIIQGESANKNYMGIYNSSFKTTPFLQSLISEKNFYCLNTISASNQTRYSVPTAFTDASVENWYDGYSKKLSLISDFKENRYKTYWLSTQGQRGLHEDSITSIANEADIKKFFYSDAKKDFAVVDYLNEISNQLNTKELFVFHIMGSHFNYEERYPKDFSPKSSTFKEKYENSIRYTDLIIEKIVNYFHKRGDSFLVIYFSDHGEVVSESKHGHGYFPSYKEEYEIPFCIYSSINNSQLKDFYKKNNNRLINAENMNSYIKYISGITDEVNISYATKVFSLDPKNIIDYKELNSYEKK
jgi:heptose-I-phosphate ethanolaminephosphotransferase